MTYVVDKIENGLAVLESLTTYGYLRISAEALPKNVREGHVLIQDGATFTIDRDATKKRREGLKERLRKILQRG